MDNPSEEEFPFLEPPLEPDEIGRLGSYRVLKLLGQGGMGLVFLAEEDMFGRPVALKVMSPKLATNSTARQRFLGEARAVESIEHEHVVAIFDVSEDAELPYFAMEYLRGLPLDQYLLRGRKVKTSQILRLSREVAEGLAAAHEQGLIHRDVKPANIWLEAPAGHVKLLDFGLARQSGGTSMTQAGTVVGTPAYMSPEQAKGEKVDGRSDLFSLGCVMYRLCTGDLPFKGPNNLAVLVALTTEAPRPPKAIDPQLPPSVNDLVMRLLAKNPDDRPQSALAVVAAIKEIERAFRKQQGE